MGHLYSFLACVITIATPHVATAQSPDTIRRSTWDIDVADTIPLQDSTITAWDEYIQQNTNKQVEELASLLAIPSVSSLPAHKSDMIRAAEWLVLKLKNIGMSTSELVTTEGHPVVLARWTEAAGKPTVLIYGHYDVQPVDSTQWNETPFQAREKEGRVYGRGAADDKGGLLIPVWATEALLKATGTLPVNVIFVFDGEEEIGSPNFRNFLEKHSSSLKSDFAYNADATQYSDSVPSIWMSLRGSASLEFTVKTANIDAHSGLYGGKTPNALKAAAQIIASLFTADGKVAVAGFYNSVQPLSKEERARVNQVPYDKRKDMDVLGTKLDVGDAAFTPLERLWFRPTLEVTGFWGGYTAHEGFANIIPSSAHVRLNCRTVPRQQGDKIIQLIRQHIDKNCPKGASISYKSVGQHAAPIKFPSTGASFQYVYDALNKVYNRKPLLTAIGGSIAAITHIKEILGIYAYSFGFQQTDENFHAANEFIRISDMQKGQRAYCLLLQSISKAKK